MFSSRSRNLSLRSRISALLNSNVAKEEDNEEEEAREEEEEGEEEEVEEGW